MGSGLDEFETDFGFSIGSGVAKGDAAGLFFSSCRIFDDDDLPEGNRQVQIDECTMGADNDGMCALGDMHVVGTTGDDLDRNAEKDALAAAPVGHRRKIRRERGHELRLVDTYDLWGVERQEEEGTSG